MCLGIFDSGVGGLSVWKELVRIMPGISMQYFSDGAFCPYGNRSQKDIISRAYIITDLLISKGAVAVVVACNTATTAAISALREKYTIPFIGMEPAVKPAALHSKSGVIGVLATKNTLNGNHYHTAVERFASDVKVISQVGEGLVELVEIGETKGERVISLLKKYIDPMLEQGADHIVLGCTHYPFLLDSIKLITGDKVVIVDPAPAVAQHTLNIINENKFNLIRIDNPHFATLFNSSSSIDVLRLLAKRVDPLIPDDNFKKINI